MVEFDNRKCQVSRKKLAYAKVYIYIIYNYVMYIHIYKLKSSCNSLSVTELFANSEF